MEDVIIFGIGGIVGIIIGVFGTNCKDTKHYCDCYPTHPVTTDDRCSDCGKPIIHLKR